ncbi:T9SS type A sorting domain-containing protein [Hymenobacter persicinus]|uniref:T9SS type A sorting domain-containing protein n=1 Tax=Hymenobacter persicinus TaxID=2025506 RepID=A0A4Q5LAR3_9BACT|nr:T9SS type A sorting domain-containing protein [Hymenobacter persicinus]RYU79139.1 T9SS type A sorting domain-containing protein [Hymenobacter persicinus]
MKTALLRFSLLAAAGLLTLGTARAQQAVSNGTLETWVTRHGDAPTDWLTFDDALAVALPGFPLPPSGGVTKSTDAHAGSFAAKLTSVNLTFPPVVGPGLLALGTKITQNDVDADTLDLVGGLPYTSRPARMQFYYKFAGTVATSDDRPTASVALTRTVGGVRQLVAKGRLFLPTTATTYTLATVPLTYKSSVVPDSIHIVFASADVTYDSNSDFTAGNSLFIDDVVMTGTATATRDAQLQAAVGVYPNPSTTGLFALAATTETSLLTGAYTVTDALGRVVLSQPAQPANATGTRPVDLRSQPAGVYSLRLDTPRGPVMHQLLIK